MKVTNIGKLLPEDFQGMPSWAENLLTRLNDHIQSVQQILSRKITINDNCLGAITELTFRTSSTVSSTWPISIAMSIEPKVAWIGKITDTTVKEVAVMAPRIAWKWEKGTFTILDMDDADLTASHTYRIQIVSFGG